MGITTAELERKPFVRQLVMSRTVTIDSTAVDAGNSGQTHILRAGLLLAYDSVSGAYEHYQPAGANGTDVADCILLHDVDLKDGDPSAASADRPATVMFIGEAVSSECILYDANAATDLSKSGGGEGLIVFS